MRGFMRDITAHPGRGRGYFVSFSYSQIAKLVITCTIMMPIDMLVKMALNFQTTS